MTIYFYTRGEPYEEFSNFSRHGFELDGKYWKTSEHYFQAMKFAGTEYEEKVRNAPTPKEAANLGRQRDWPLRKDWESVKDDVMRCAVRQKFLTHPELKELLLSTGEEEIVENAPGDYYWGCGKDGTGKNILGKILMELRTHLRAE
jgi:N-glycosidase YbiA